MAPTNIDKSQGPIVFADLKISKKNPTKENEAWVSTAVGYRD